MLADVGLVGLPNAGKSTLLSVLTAAKPKIANYPFTTLEPNLGMVRYRDDRSFVMADIPGIIEGAAEGRGLGLRFLRHIERNALLLFMIPADTEHIADEYRLLLGELVKYNRELVEKRKVLAITKCDLIDEEIQGWLLDELHKELDADLPIVFISSAAHMGLTELKDLLWQELNRETKHRPESLIQQTIDVTSLSWEDEDEDLPELEEEDEWNEEWAEGEELEFDWDELPEAEDSEIR